METPEGRKFVNHDWFVAAITFVAAVGSSLLIYAYGEGQMEHRVETLEKQNAQLREDWKEARARIERALATKEKNQ